MNYDDNSSTIKGAFYSSTSTNKLRLNYFKKVKKIIMVIKLLNNVMKKRKILS